ncbi:phospholipid carrier-dependent glycosyltransferase [Streptomyces sp. BE20]|uniref:phospholipid carrier-dependent glycosyltransferase n=1 Tax=Streptomyces sp. BE20 TaxID=3002525 RepID=UPI002E7AA4F1|nr:phospholipid carrier-dependent glycosyltransferase [Streptomyces sp. BE20]MEE1828905.1 phospholipid carrier-dependent glycosyltransferase [Streptomyces sp. BE20]
MQRFEEARGRRWFWPAALVVGYAVEVAFRLVLVRHLSYPSVHADEDSYLVLARVLAGRQTTEMPVGVVIPGGYPLLISPALRLSDDPAMAYHLIMGINALLNALVFPLAYLALRRLGLRRLLAYVFAGVTALLPPVIFYSEYVMADTVLPVLILAWLLCMHGWLSDGPTKHRYWYAAGTGAAAAYSLATHDRGGVVVALTGVVFVGVLLLRWAPWRTTVAGLGALGAGVLFAKALSWWLNRQFEVEPSKVGSYLWDGLKNPDILQRTLTRTTGQIWYFIVSTWGIGGLAVVTCLFALFSSRFPRPHRIVGGVMVALLFGTALASAAALPDDARIDNWVYARYLSYLVPVAFVAGVAVLARFGRRSLGYAVAGTVGLTLLLAQLVIWSAGSQLYKQVFIGWGMPDVLFLASDWSKLNMMRSTTAAFIILGAVVMLLLAGGRKVLWAVGLSLALFAGFATTTITEQITDPYTSWRKTYATGFTKAAGIKPKDNVVLAWDLDGSTRMAQAYEVYLGRVWYRDPRWQPVPPQANVIVTPLPEEGKAPEAYWHDHPEQWYVERVNKGQGWMVWRKH